MDWRPNLEHLESDAQIEVDGVEFTRAELFALKAMYDGPAYALHKRIMDRYRQDTVDASIGKSGAASDELVRANGAYCIMQYIASLPAAVEDTISNLPQSDKSS